MFWLTFKTWIQAVTGLERDALHIYAAVSVQVVTAVLLRKPLSDWAPVSIVAALELLNEANDLHQEHWPDRMLQVGASLHDIVNTMIMPVVILMLMRQAQANAAAASANAASQCGGGEADPN